MYMLAYRDLGIFYENVVNRFLRDIVTATEPISATLIGEFTPRGGIQSKITASWNRDRGYGV
jgi:7-cyano-7-deazaguanine reductase